MTQVLIRDRREAEESPCEDGGGDWRNVAKSPRAPRTTGSVKIQGKTVP